MFSPHKHWFLCVFLYIINSKTCCSEPGLAPSLVLYSPGEPEYTDVLVRRVGDNLTLVCEMKPPTRVTHIWNYVRNGTLRESVTPTETSSDGSRSVVWRAALREADSGRYLCSAPPFSVSKYVLVQRRGEISCARGAFWCGVRCVLVAYVCDGRTDCLHGEDERAPLCPHNVCDRADKLNCTSGRCISAAACCRAGTPLCQQPSCCDQHMPRDLEVEPEYPALFEDRRAPDDYGFIQSTIYTVTACALIFMIAVVLLVSAICKMQMKRAALRGYAHADRAATHHYSVAYHQSARFPPCYEAARLLPDGPPSPPAPPAPPAAPPSPPHQCGAPGRGLARLSAIFSSRYRQVPLPSSDVPTSPAHVRALDRRLTLQLGTGRFQVSLGRFGRPRADTPTVAALELDMLHLSPEHYADAYSEGYSAVDTYTLNGRTVRLLGADIDTYEPEPPCYNDLQRYKQLGPPPEYLSRERLPCDREGDAERSDRHEWQDRQAATNVELPPGYHELGASAGWASGDGGSASGESGVIGSGFGESGSGESGVIGSGSGESASGSAANEETCTSGNATCQNRSSSLVLIENEIERARDIVSASNNMLNIENATVVDIANGNVAESTESNIETLSSIIDNLPAIDSDVNANDSDMINHVIRDPINSSNTVIDNDNTLQNENTLNNVSTLNNHSVVIINNATNDTAINNNA